MTRALSPPAASARFGLAQAIRALPYASFTLVIAVVVTCGVGIATMPSSSANDLAIHVDAAPAASAEATESATEAVAARTRCAGCGFVESIRPLAPVAGRPAEFEFTVRLRDGSTRVSRTVGKAKWRSGDRIVLMGGAPPSRN